MEGGAEAEAEAEADNSNTNTIIQAQFVVKTYQMVNDPTTVNLITWGRANNSFIVVDPLHFSQTLLPLYFKHNNFSSFIRQLNTYGFRKVDPDRWEFANEWFLRGQTQLLKNIARKKQSRNDINYSIHHKVEDEEDILMEIAKLKQEQKQLDLQVEGMTKRLQATERRPHQMMTFIYKLVEDPEILSQMMAIRVTNKKRRLRMSSASSSSSEMVMMASSVRSEEAEEIATVGTMSSPEPNLDGWPSPETTLPVWVNQRQATGGAAGIGDLSYFGGGAAWGDSSPPPYPFSLLGGGFFSS